MHFGIDYGSKLAGTTVITFDMDGELSQVASDKKQDADKIILKLAESMKPVRVYIDAPLSLPLAYYGKGDDFHYRAVDRALGAMSPMFLGGLTARAMKLKSQLQGLGIDVYETYPGAFIKNNTRLKEVYLKKEKNCIPSCISILKELIPYKLDLDIDSLHKLDSLIAWHSGYRHIRLKANEVGEANEGVIIY